MRRAFSVESGGRTHEVIIDASLVTGRETILLDGQTVSSVHSFSFRRRYRVPIEGRDVQAEVSVAWYGAPRLRLLVDGIPVDERPVPGVTAVLVSRPPVPAWGWLFVVACALIPVVSLGGALPSVIGVASALGCHEVLRTDRTPASKAARCAGITGLAWGLLVAVWLGFGMLRLAG